MARLAFLFPGQGSQYVGMGQRLFNEDGEAKRVFEEASGVLGFDIADLCFNGPEEKLNLTQYTQPAILTVSIAAYGLLTREGFLPDMVAGHSLGEYSALVASDAMKFTDAVYLVHRRGIYMQEALSPDKSLVAAILGLDRQAVEDICREASGKGIVSVANYNSPVQIVIAGEKEAVRLALDIAEKRKAKRIIILPVSAPVHSPLMKDAAERLSLDMEKIGIGDLRYPLVCNVDAMPISRGEEARSCLIRQITSPVQWEDSIRRMIASGVSSLIEIGPKNVLTGLVKRIDKNIRTSNIENKDSLKEAMDIIWT